jgi:hypothetical protein
MELCNSSSKHLIDMTMDRLSFEGNPCSLRRSENGREMKRDEEGERRSF